MIYSRNYRATNDAAILVHSLPNLQDYNHAIFLFLFSQQPSLLFYCPIRAADQSIIRFNKKQKKKQQLPHRTHFWYYALSPRLLHHAFKELVHDGQPESISGYQTRKATD